MALVDKSVDSDLSRKAALHQRRRAWLITIVVYLACFIPAYLIFGDIGVIVLVLAGLVAVSLWQFGIWTFFV